MRRGAEWTAVPTRLVRASASLAQTLRHFAVLILTLLFLCGTVNAQSWQYVYDEVGRLKAAIAPSGERADYEYDAVGNIIAIRRSAAGVLDISEFTPQIGKSGTVVKITGSGFSTTLANNIVKFNGVTATVTAATATQLTVTAPATGTTGPISVTVGASTATARESFVYSSTIITGAPTIATATPTCAVPGRHCCADRHQLRCCTGRHARRARQHGRTDHGHQSDGLVVCSPAGRHLRIARRDSPRHLGYFDPTLKCRQRGSCADYETAVRPVLNGATATLNIATAGKKAVVLFSGNASAALSLQFSSLAPSIAGTALNYTIYNTANAVIGSGALSPSAMSIHVPLLPVTGTYAVVFSWNNAAVTGTAAFQLQSNASLEHQWNALCDQCGSACWSVRSSGICMVRRVRTGRWSCRD